MSSPVGINQGRHPPPPGLQSRITQPWGELAEGKLLVLMGSLYPECRLQCEVIKGGGEELATS